MDDGRDGGRRGEREEGRKDGGDKVTKTLRERNLTDHMDEGGSVKTPGIPMHHSHLTITFTKLSPN